MIRVTLEMWPQGDPTRKYPLGHLDIINVGSNADRRRGSYTSRFFGKTNHQLVAQGDVADWPRLSRPVFSLLKTILEKAGY